MKSVFQYAAPTVLLIVLMSAQNVGLAADSPASLSGDYRLRFEQTSKNCGPQIDPVEMEVTFTFSDTNVTMSFPNDFLGIDVLDAKFDPDTGTVSDQLQKSVSLGPTEAILSLDLQGNIVERGSDTEIHFEISFDKTADDADWNCRVTGEGRAVKL
jgi:hypothetical protein